MNNTIGTRIKSRRKECGMKSKELAAHAGISHIQMSRIESGSRGVTLDMLVCFAKRLNCSTDWLVGLSDDPQIQGVSILMLDKLT